MYSVAMYTHVRTLSSTVCNDAQLLTVHIILIVIGVIVYISGICVAVYLGVVLFKKASNYIGRCITYCTTHELMTVHKELCTMYEPSITVCA